MKEQAGPERTRSPYMSLEIYRNYEKSMKTKNAMRKRQGLTAIHVRPFEEWADA